MSLDDVIKKREHVLKKREQLSKKENMFSKKENIFVILTCNCDYIFFIYLNWFYGK